MLVSSAQAQTNGNYNGNSGTSFGGAIGNGMLTFTNDGTTLFGTLTTSGTDALSGDSNKVVIYIDSQAGGATSTASFTDDGGTTPDNIRSAISGYNGTLRSTANFATNFGADYAIGLQSDFGFLATLSTPSNFGFDQNISLAHTAGTNVYTFNITLANIGSPTSFNFSTTYLYAIADGTGSNGNGLYRSNEAFNSLTDVTNTANTGSPGQDTVSVGFDTYNVPEPRTWAMMVGSFVALMAATFRRRRV